MTSATEAIRNTAPPPPTASAAPEIRVRFASHWPNSQLASEAAIVSRVTMRTAVAMKDADPWVGASVRARAVAVNSATRPHRRVATEGEKRVFQRRRECFTIRAMTSRDSKPGASPRAPPRPALCTSSRSTSGCAPSCGWTSSTSRRCIHEEREDAWSTRAAIGSLLEILAITARGDIRSEVLKELERQMSVMHDYQARPGVDTGRLQPCCRTSTRLRTELNSAGALFMQRLRDSEFLNAIKHRSTIPGGTCEFDLPDYRHWLDQPFAVRSAAFDEWMATIRPLCDAVTELLWLTREAARPRPETAVGGTFQLAFERDNPCQLLRIALPAGTHAVSRRSAAATIAAASAS